MRRLIAVIFCLCAVRAAISGKIEAAEIVVSSAPELHAALKQLQPGTTVLIAPGVYDGWFLLKRVVGTPDAPVRLQAQFPDNPPVFHHHAESLHLSDCAYVTLKSLIVEGQASNGVNIDDGGTYETPSHHIVVEDVTIRNVGPVGNHDGLKLSGVTDFRVSRCRIEGWGGSAIDMVGCVRGVIEACEFRGKKGFSQMNGVQAKGGAREIVIQTSRFYDAGARAVQLGGRTELVTFRPTVKPYEATAIEVAGNRFFGGETPIAFVTANGGYAHHNTIFFPRRWALRILQETGLPSFPPCQNGRFEQNVILYDARMTETVNVGLRTAPQTFTFARNVWVRVDSAVLPALPSPEIGGQLLDKTDLDFSRLPEIVLNPPTRHLDAGADAYRVP